MAQLSKLKPGDVLWEVQRQRMGNTKAITQALYQAVVIEVHCDHAMISWNNNPPRKYFDVKHLRTKKPVMVKTWNGYGSRLATRDEIKAMKEAANG